LPVEAENRATRVHQTDRQPLACVSWKNCYFSTFSTRATVCSRGRWHVVGNEREIMSKLVPLDIFTETVSGALNTFCPEAFGPPSGLGRGRLVGRSCGHLRAT